RELGEEGVEQDPVDLVAVAVAHLRVERLDVLRLCLQIRGLPDEDRQGVGEGVDPFPVVAGEDPERFDAERGADPPAIEAVVEGRMASEAAQLPFDLRDPDDCPPSGGPPPPVLSRTAFRFSKSFRTPSRSPPPRRTRGMPAGAGSVLCSIPAAS